MGADVILLIVGLFALMLGYPVALTLGGVAIVFALGGVWFGVFDYYLLLAIPSRLFGIMTSQVLLAIPMFVLMGMLLEKSGIAESMFSVLSRLLRKQRGGLLMSVTLVGGLMAASTGIVGASVVTLGLLALPALLNNGVSKADAAGAIAASGTLGQIIPPSIVLIVLGDQMSNSYQKMQSDAGSFSSDAVTVTDLFAGALLPGLLLVGLYLCWQFFRSSGLNASGGGAPSRGDYSDDFDEKPAAFTSLLSPLMLILLVLGSILAGVATPTEAAALGAVGALLLACGKQSKTQGFVREKLPHVGLVTLGVLLVGGKFFDPSSLFFVTVAGFGTLVVFISIGFSIVGLFRIGILRPVLSESVQLIAMIFLIVFGTSIFALVFRGLGGDDTIAGLLQSLPGGTIMAVVLVMVAIFVLGFFLEFLEITYLVIPLVAPALLAMPMADGSMMSPVWLGVLIAINLQTSFLTPPFGVALFYLRSVTSASVATIELYRGVIPYIVLQLIGLACVLLFPKFATWLPHLLYGF